MSVWIENDDGIELGTSEGVSEATWVGLFVTVGVTVIVGLGDGSIDNVGEAEGSLIGEMLVTLGAIVIVGLSDGLTDRIGWADGGSVGNTEAVDSEVDEIDGFCEGNNNPSVGGIADGEAVRSDGGWDSPESGVLVFEGDSVGIIESACVGPGNGESEGDTVVNGDAMGCLVYLDVGAKLNEDGNGGDEG
jgi:hypothetical protein